VNERSKALIKEINEHKIQDYAAIERIIQELGQTKEGLDRSVEGIANEIRAMSSALQFEKQNALSEFQKLNLAVSRIEANITAGPATQTQSAVCTTPNHTSPVRAEDIGQGNINTTASPHSHSDNASCAASMIGLSTCNVSACNGSVNNVLTGLVITM
jgi:hypothetical protein